VGNLNRLIQLKDKASQGRPRCVALVYLCGVRSHGVTMPRVASPCLARVLNWSRRGAFIRGFLGMGATLVPLVVFVAIDM
jgi:hypothetical protein